MKRQNNNKCVRYCGEDLVCSGINKGDNFNTVIKKINNSMCEKVEISYIDDDNPFPESGNSNTIYVEKNCDENVLSISIWDESCNDYVTITNCVPCPPDEDGKIYGIQNKQWVEVPGGGGSDTNIGNSNLQVPFGESRLLDVNLDENDAFAIGHWNEQFGLILRRRINNRFDIGTGSEEVFDSVSVSNDENYFRKESSWIDNNNDSFSYYKKISTDKNSAFSGSNYYEKIEWENDVFSQKVHENYQKDSQTDSWEIYYDGFEANEISSNYRRAEYKYIEQGHERHFSDGYTQTDRESSCYLSKYQTRIGYYEYQKDIDTFTYEEQIDSYHLFYDRGQRQLVRKQDLLGNSFEHVGSSELRALGKKDNFENYDMGNLIEYSECFLDSVYEVTYIEEDSGLHYSNQYQYVRDYYVSFDNEEIFRLSRSLADNWNELSFFGVPTIPQWVDSEFDNPVDSSNVESIVQKLVNGLKGYGLIAGS